MSTAHFDAFVVGAGFGGIYQCYSLKKLGLNVKVIDAAGGVGGTWYWNKYPGAMSDTESYLYRYSWDKEGLRSYPWSHHYLTQKEILAYLNHVVDVHDLRPNIQLNTEMLSAAWDETSQTWLIGTTNGSFTARYLITSLGLLSKQNFPNIPGINTFKGDLTHTASWKPDLDLTGKRVGVIGNGSTGTQVMTAIAPIVGSLTSFQRHPQYSVPSGNKPVTPEYRQWVNDNYDAIWDQAFNSSTAFGFVESTRPVMSVSPEERQQIFQELWDRGNGFRFMFGGFGDITTSEEANAEAAGFIRSKIAEIVRDPVKAKLLQPNDLYARRPMCDGGYYQIFNRENVDVVDVGDKNPISEIVATGLKTKDGKVYELDSLIFATGFDAIDGNYLRMKITGRCGRTIQEHWKDGATSYLGVALSGFPNMFMVLGPQGPFANNPPAIESEVEFITAAIANAEKRRISDPNLVLCVSKKAETGWGKLCDQLTEGSLFKKTASWIFGANIPGKKETTKFYFGGLKKYRDRVREDVDGGFEHFYGVDDVVSAKI